MKSEQTKTLKDHLEKFPDSAALITAIWAIDLTGYVPPHIRLILIDSLRALVQRSYDADYSNKKHAPDLLRMKGRHYHNGVENIRIRDGEPVPDGYIPGMIRKTATKWKRDIQNIKSFQSQTNNFPKS